VPLRFLHQRPFCHTASRSFWVAAVTCDLSWSIVIGTI
jgi:hypothetical protein